MKLMKHEYEIAEEYLEYLREQNIRESAMVTLIRDKEERADKVEILERERTAINVLIQTLNNCSVKEV